MSQEVLDYLNLKSGDTVIDCTLGAGGHSLDILNQISPSGMLIGIDQDEDILQIAREHLRAYEDRCRLIYGNFENIDAIINDMNITGVDAILYDLGVSSFQLDNPSKGFSFSSEGPLDMRMDKNQRITAFDLVNNLSQEEISKILYRYGQERYARRIAREIVARRKRKLITSTGELAQTVQEAVPFLKYRQRIHPATRTFQAFRIAVNNELESLKVSLQKATRIMKAGARICVISFHSLEDKIVKNRFRDLSREHILTLLTKKPVRASQEEIRQNPRARSARLRAAIKKDEIS